MCHFNDILAQDNKTPRTHIDTISGFIAVLTICIQSNILNEFIEFSYSFLLTQSVFDQRSRARSWNSSSWNHLWNWNLILTSLHSQLKRDGCINLQSYLRLSQWDECDRNELTAQNVDIKSIDHIYSFQFDTVDVIKRLKYFIRHIKPNSYVIFE